MSFSKAEKKKITKLAFFGSVVGVIALIALIYLSLSTPAPSTVKAPNHPILSFWPVPSETISLSGVQGSGQLYNQDFVPTRSRTTFTGKDLPCSSTCNTFWCTGMTGGAFVPVVTNDFIAVSTEFGVASLNVTGDYQFQFVLFIGTSIPSTSFITGHCASGGIEIGNFIVTTTTLTRTFTGQMLVFTKQPTATYYSWLEVELVNQVSVKATFAEGGNGPNLSMWDASLIKTPLAGSPSASSSQGTGTVPDQSTPAELPTTQAYRRNARLQTQTSFARLNILISVSASSAGGFNPDPICAPCVPVWIQFSSDGGTTFTDLCGAGTETPRVDISQVPSSNPYPSAFCQMLPSAMGTGNIFRAVWDGGDSFTLSRLVSIDLELSPSG